MAYNNLPSLVFKRSRSCVSYGDNPPLAPAPPAAVSSPTFLPPFLYLTNLLAITSVGVCNNLDDVNLITFSSWKYAREERSARMALVVRRLRMNRVDGVSGFGGRLVGRERIERTKPIAFGRRRGPKKMRRDWIL